MAADSALGFLAELAAMKAGDASTAYDGPIEEEKPKKKKKKKGKKTGDKKGKKGKKGAAITDDPEPKSKKGKKKGKKKKTAPPVAITDEPEEEDEKTPEPPSNLSEIEKRKFRLKYARKKLEKRKKQREQVRAQKAAKDGSTSQSTEDAFKQSYGKTYIDKFMKQLQSEKDIVQSKIAEAIREEEEQQKAAEAELKDDGILSGLGLSSDAASKRKKKHKSLERKPGRINHLTFGDESNHGIIVEKRTKSHNQHCQTDSVMFEDYLREEFMDDFQDRDGNPLSIDIKVIAGLVESVDKFGYPRELWEIQSAQSPSPTAEKIRSRQRMEDERKAKQMALKEKRKREREEEIARRKNIPYMSRKDANKLVKGGDFLENFRKKAKWIERTLGINMEHMEAIRDRDDDFFDDDDDDDELEEYKEYDDEQDEYKDDIKEPEKQLKNKRGSVMMKQGRRKEKVPKNYLKLRKKFGINSLNGRPIGNINFSASNRDWFAATYFVAGNKYSTDKNGRIGIWNFMLPTYPEYELSAQNMITSTHFHPTDPFLIFGSTINGQILMWDLRNNKQKPIERSNFSNGHSAPVFTMSFLPNIKQKQAEIAKKKGKVLKSSKQNKPSENEHDVQHILSVSNDGKLCIWRTDQLSVKPLNQSILKPSDDQSTARQIELITTCFDYSYRDHGNVILGSDEGYLYKAEIFNQNNNNDSLSIKESINGHYGPITSLNFFPIKYYNKTYNFKDNVTGLYLTSSYDWTVKLWHNKIGTKLGKHNNGPLSVFDQMTDYVYDVKWNIGGKPGVFACCDGEGQINLFDLTKDFKHPITKNPIKITDQKNIAATTLEWTFDGKYLACGDSDGNILFYNVHKSISNNTLETCEAFQSVANKYVVQI